MKNVRKYIRTPWDRFRRWLCRDMMAASEVASAAAAAQRIVVARKDFETRYAKSEKQLHAFLDKLQVLRFERTGEYGEFAYTTTISAAVLMQVRDPHELEMFAHYAARGLEAELRRSKFYSIEPKRPRGARGGVGLANPYCDPSVLARDVGT